MVYTDHKPYPQLHVSLILPCIVSEDENLRVSSGTKKNQRQT